MERMENGCKDHSMICEAVEDLKDWKKDFEKVLPSLVRTKTLWTFLSLAVVIALAVIGFLWSQQEKSVKKVEATQEEIKTTLQVHADKDKKYRNRMENNMNRLMWKLGVPPNEKGGED